MRVLHTADWHIGCTLGVKKRYEESEQFLDWLIDTIHQKHVDILLVAGDIFDTASPTNRGLELYFGFLGKLADTSCQHVVITGGNHDSPSFLNAPRDILRKLKALNVHVIGAAMENCEEEVLVLSDQEGHPELIVCAVPYLRDRDIRIAEAGETIENKDRKLMEGIHNHYFKVAEHAEQKRKELGAQIPIIGMGHLFAAGGQTVEGDGVRELYIGTLAHVPAQIFPACFDYLALGHLHVPQRIKGSEIMRYSGSPLQMGFGETKDKKSVCLVEFVNTKASVKLVNIPIFQRLERVRGMTWDEISSRLLELAATKTSIWLEIIHEGEEVISDLHERVEIAIADTGLEKLFAKSLRVSDRVLNQLYDDKTLDDLNIHQVFERCLAAHNVPEEQRPEILRAYQEIVTFHLENDIKAE